MVFESNGVEETKQIAQTIAADISAGDVVCLQGELGAGKTAFAAGFAKAFGFDGYVSSPTFALIHEYHTNKVAIYHFDMYRIENEEDAYAAGVDEYLYADGICLIEWADNIAALLPKRHYTVTIEKDPHKGDAYRKILFEAEGLA